MKNEQFETYSKIKISFDLDGVLYGGKDTKNTRALYKILHRDQFTEVGILTGHSHDSEKWDIETILSYGLPAPDFYFGRTPEYMDRNGAVYKSMIIKRENIDLHIDDYDYDYSETIKIFNNSDIEQKILRAKAFNNKDLPNNE